MSNELTQSADINERLYQPGHCPHCGSYFRAGTADIGDCARCGKSWPLINGREPAPQPTDTEQRHDAILSHMAERLTAFLGLPEKRISSVEKSLTLLRESLAIWTMHDLPRSAPEPKDAADQQTEARHETTQKSLQQLGIEIREINAANGWAVTQLEEFTDKYKFPAVLALIHSEVSEALEAFRENDLPHFREELADVLIRVLDCAIAVDNDFDATVGAKLQVNRGRGFHHGGKKRI